MLVPVWYPGSHTLLAAVKLRRSTGFPEKIPYSFSGPILTKERWIRRAQNSKLSLQIASMILVGISSADNLLFFFFLGSMATTTAADFREKEHITNLASSLSSEYHSSPSHRIHERFIQRVLTNCRARTTTKVNPPAYF